MLQQQVILSSWRILKVEREPETEHFIRKKEGTLSSKRPSWQENRFYLNDNDYLTGKEAEMFYYFLQGNKKQQLSKLLGKSIRTIENYINFAKERFGMCSLPEVIEHLKKLDFLEKYKQKHITKNKNHENTIVSYTNNKYELDIQAP
jgi:DNA-binding CsgD family transcriptional regulator